MKTSRKTLMTQILTLERKLQQQRNNTLAHKKVLVGTYQNQEKILLPIATLAMLWLIWRKKPQAGIDKIFNGLYQALFLVGSRYLRKLVSLSYKS